MEIKQVKSIVQSAVNQIIGENTIADIEASSIVDIGKNIVDADRVDAVLRTLASMVGKIELQNGVYKNRLKSLFVDSCEWGGFIERVYIDLEDCYDSWIWSLEDKKNYANDEHTYHKPKVSAKIFEEAKPYGFVMSTSVEQFKEAFNSWDEMNKYLSMLRNNIRNTIEVAIESLEHVLISAAVAVSDKALNNSVHLLSEAKLLGLLGQDATASDFLKSVDCLSFMAEKIANVKGYMLGINKVFNNKNVATFCEEADVILLNDIKNMIDYRVRPHNYQDLVNIDCETIIAWQGVTGLSNSYDFETLSSIKISADESQKLGIGSGAVEIKNVAGLVKDRKSIGICPYKEKVTSSYTACADFWNEFTNILMNFILDSNYQMVAFIID